MISGLPTLTTSKRSVNNNFVKYNQMSWLNKNYNTKNSSIWSTETFLYDIMKPRYKQNYMWYQISRI